MADFPRDLKVGKKDNFTITASDKYLDGEVLSGATVTTNSANLIINTVAFSDNVVSATCTGVSEGEADLKYSFESPSRSICITHTVIVSPCD